MPENNNCYTVEINETTDYFKGPLCDLLLKDINSESGTAYNLTVQGEGTHSKVEVNIPELDGTRIIITTKCDVQHRLQGKECDLSAAQMPARTIQIENFQIIPEGVVAIESSEPRDITIQDLEGLDMPGFDGTMAKFYPRKTAAHANIDPQNPSGYTIMYGEYEVGYVEATQEAMLLIPDTSVRENYPEPILIVDGVNEAVERTVPSDSDEDAVSANRSESIIDIDDLDQYVSGTTPGNCGLSQVVSNSNPSPVSALIGTAAFALYLAQRFGKDPKQQKS